MNDCPERREWLRRIVELATGRGVPCYICRRPGASDFEVGASSSAIRCCGMEFPDEKGFFIHPFDVGSGCDAWFIPQRHTPADAGFWDWMENFTTTSSAYRISGEDVAYPDYLEQVRTLVGAMRRGDFRKAVLSRTITKDDSSISSKIPELLFRMSEAYPRTFVFWVYLPGVCAWVGATPETLLRCDDRGVFTVALAGSRPAETAGEWGAKERDEQQIVTDSIVQTFRKAGIEPSVHGPETLRAAAVEHLCTTIESSGMLSGAQTASLLGGLHPTPALGGYPKKESLSAIRRVEKHPRRYYGGFVGCVENTNEFTFYVNLRCMEYDDMRYRLYVGGGITADSDPDAEWRETEIKSRTILNLLDKI